MNVKQSIQKTHELLKDREHWTQGYWGGTDEGYYCLIGALRESIGYDWYNDIPNEPEAYDDAVKLIASCIPEDRIADHDELPVNKVIQFNDSESTTHDDVVQVLVCALQKAETEFA